MKKLLLITLMLALGLTGFSQTKTFTHVTPVPEWDNDANWIPPGIPVNTDNVVIPDGEKYKVTLSAHGVCRDLTIGEDVILEIFTTFNRHAILTYSGDVYVEGKLGVRVASTMKYEPMTSIVVTSNANDGPYTLRRAIEYIADGGTITFDLPGAEGQEDIYLTGSEIEINKSLTIDGSNTAGNGNTVSVYGDGTTHRIFHILSTANGKTIEFNNMEINEGYGTGLGGGGILCEVGTLIVDNVYFFQNDAKGTDVHGGAIYAKNSNCTITNSTFDENFSDVKGGGMFAMDANVTITGCTFSNNKANGGGGADKGGGAIHIFAAGNHTLSLINSTFFSNSAPNGYGGAIYIASPTNMKFTTVSNNSASIGGGGVFNLITTDVKIQNCMLGNNSAGGSPNDFTKLFGHVIDGGHNIVEFSEGFSWNAAGDITGQQDDLFGAGHATQTLAYNGGPTQTLAIEDVYSAAWYAGIADGTVTTDQRGTVRQNPPTIGAFDYPATTVASSGEIWMDRNLGASQVATSSTDEDAYGDLYQWGRFIEGHQIRTSSVHSGQATTPVPNAGNDWDSKFITGTSDWLTPHDNTLWQGEAGVNNPCPDGFRLPTEVEWEAERATWATNDDAGAFASLQLTVGGYRAHSNASLVNVGGVGYYWSSTVHNTQAKVMRIAGPGGGNTEVYSDDRAFGLSVRCIKE